MTTASTQRHCFTRGCPGTPQGNAWECDVCRARIHAASVAATERAARRKRARELADTLPHTKVAADLGRTRANSTDTAWGGWQ
jgi:hypothetical protein